MMQPRTIRLISETQLKTAIQAVSTLPVGNNLEIVIRETPKARSNDQNAMYWAVLGEIAEQAWLNNRQFSADAWHIHCKQAFMPDEDLEPYTFEHVKKPENYHKYDYLPNGDRTCIASTTDLTKHGFSEYMTKVYALGGELGVLFSEVKR